MPATSKKQFRFMQAIAHGGIKDSSLSPSKAAEFVAGQKNYKDLPRYVAQRKKREARSK